MHMFFQGLDWITLQQCHLEPPHVPEIPPPKEKPAYKSYEDMMKQIDKDEKEEVRVKSEASLKSDELGNTKHLQH